MMESIDYDDQCLGLTTNLDDHFRTMECIRNPRLINSTSELVYITLTPERKKRYIFYFLLAVFFGANVVYNVFTLSPLIRKFQYITTATKAIMRTSEKSDEDNFRNMMLEDNFQGSNNAKNGVVDVIHKDNVHSLAEQGGRLDKNPNHIDTDKDTQANTQIGSSKYIANPTLVDVNSITQNEENVSSVDDVNPLRSTFQDLISAVENRGTSKQHILPYFWITTIPDAKGKYTTPRFLYECFHLNRAMNGESKSNQNHLDSIHSSSNSREQLISGHELSDAVNIFKGGETHNIKGLIFTLLQHPVQRAALLFEQIKNDPIYKQDLKDMDLVAYAQHIGRGTRSDVIMEYRRHMSNWLTRSLSSAGPTDKLTVKHAEEAETILREKVLVGLYDSLRTSVVRMKSLLNIDDNLPINHKKQLDLCLTQYISTSSLTGETQVVQSGSKEYIALAKINYHDMMLYNKAQYIFWDQEKLVMMMKKSAKPTSTLAQPTTTITSPDQFPSFWDTIPPVTDKKMSSFFDTCLYLTRTITDEPNEEILTAHNVREALFLFNNNNNPNDNNILHHEKGRFLALFVHPIQRAALIFHQYKQIKSAADPNYDARIENVSLLNFATYLLSTNEKYDGNDSTTFPVLRYNMSNFLTNALLHSSSSSSSSRKGVEGEEAQQQKIYSEIESMTRLLKKQCITKLVDNIEEACHGYTKVLRNNKNNNSNEKQKINDCITVFTKEQKQATMNLKEETVLVSNESEEWKVLEKLNQKDISLYEKIKHIFYEQGEVSFSDSSSSDVNLNEKRLIDIMSSINGGV